MAERLLCKQIVVGSIPAASTTAPNVDDGIRWISWPAFNGGQVAPPRNLMFLGLKLLDNEEAESSSSFWAKARNSAFISPESREAFRRDRLRRAAGAERAPLAKGGAARRCVRPGPGRKSTAAVSNERAKESSATDGCLGNARRRRTRQSAKIAAEPTRGDEAAASEWGNPPAQAGIGNMPRRTRRTEPSQ